MREGSESGVATIYSQQQSNFQKQEKQQPQQIETCKDAKECDPYLGGKKQPIEIIFKCL